MNRLKKALAEGRKAAALGSASSTNPHAAGSAEWDAWLAGHTSWSADTNDVTRDFCSRARGGANALTWASSTLALDAATKTLAANWKVDGSNTSGKTLTATSGNTDLFTVSAAGTTDASGNKTFTLTRVANGSADITVATAGGRTAVCRVTVSGVT